MNTPRNDIDRLLALLAGTAAHETPESARKCAAFVGDRIEEMIAKAAIATLETEASRLRATIDAGDDAHDGSDIDALEAIEMVAASAKAHADARAYAAKVYSATEGA